jgi:Flp pilus assembly protein TadD
LKRDAQRALDRGKFAEAIQAGEASVAADPTDAEAWLLLGAAYDSKGRGADARRAYQSCVQQGKRGPTGECAALLR